MIKALTHDERTALLANHPAWSYVESRRALHRRFVFADFSAAIGFMMRIALEAEKMDHHPEWSNVYDKVDIWLTTHDADDVSARDVRLAEAIERIMTSL